MAEARKVVAARVIPWENQYGIAVVFERGGYTSLTQWVTARKQSGKCN